MIYRRCALYAIIPPPYLQTKISTNIGHNELLRIDNLTKGSIPFRDGLVHLVVILSAFHKILHGLFGVHVLIIGGTQFDLSDVLLKDLPNELFGWWRSVSGGLPQKQISLSNSQK